MHFTNALLVSSTWVASISALSLPRLGGLQKRDGYDYGHSNLSSVTTSASTRGMGPSSKLATVLPISKPPIGSGYLPHIPPYGTGSGRPHQPYPTGPGAPYPIKGNHTIHPSGSGHHSGHPHSTGHHSGRPHSTGHNSHSHHSKPTGDKTTTRHVKSTTVDTSIVGGSPPTSVAAAGTTTPAMPYGVAPTYPSGTADAAGTTTDASTVIGGNCPVVTPKTVTSTFTSTLVSTVTVTAGPSSDETAPTGGQGLSTHKTIKTTRTRTHTKSIHPTGGAGGYWNGTGNGTYGHPSGAGHHSGHGRPTHTPVGTGKLTSTSISTASIDYGYSTILPVMSSDSSTDSAQPTTAPTDYSDY